MNTRYNILHDVIYNYYRTGLDAMYDDEVSARENILDALSKLDAFNKENPNSMFVQFFMQSKFQEMTGIFKKSSPETKSRALELLSKLDITNSNKYRGELR
jgi:hypothetical protein